MDKIDPSSGYALNRMRRIALIAVAFALPISACGASGSKSETAKFNGAQADVAKVVDNLASAGRSGDAKKICNEILSKQLLQELNSAGGDCVTEMDRAIKDASDYDLRVTAVKVNGPNATATVRQGDDGKTATFTFVKENGAWRASALGS
jgi:hypothetical protein